MRKRTLQEEYVDSYSNQLEINDIVAINVSGEVKIGQVIELKPGKKYGLWSPYIEVILLTPITLQKTTYSATIRNTNSIVKLTHLLP